jgi:hypothetical protein
MNMVPFLNQIRAWIREIEADCIPEPVWIAEKHVFEYREVTAKVVAFAGSWYAYWHNIKQARGEARNRELD